MAYPDPSLRLPFGKGSTGHPWYTVANQFMPRNLHDVIRWSRYITMQSPTTTEVIRKLATYPITEFFIETRDPAARTKYEGILKSFRMKEALHDIGFEYHTVGNVFLSIYLPFVRMAHCPACASTYNVKTTPSFKYKDWNYIGACAKCGFSGRFSVKDTRSDNVDDMNLIKWNPLHISVNHNQITGESEYYYTIPGDIKKKVREGDRLYIDSMPSEMLSAIRNNQQFKFSKNGIYHMRNVSAGHLIEGVAVPPIISLFGLVFYQATLRKANESIAAEHMTPMRVVFPAAGSGNSDPVVAMSLRNFVGNMTDAINRHKNDPNHFLIAPSPVGFQNVGGDGRNLLVAAEIQQAEESILMSLGVSRELLSGTTNWTSSTVGLRMLSNTLDSYVLQVNSMISWVMDALADYLSITKTKVELTPFKLTDDDTIKQLLLSLEASGKISTSTLFKSLNIDPDEERERIENDLIAKAEAEVRNKFKVDHAIFLASKNVGEMMKKEEDYTSTLGKAQELAGALMDQPEAVVRQQLHQVKMSDYAMYLMTSKLLEEMHATPEHRAEIEAQKQAANGEGPSAEESQGQAPQAQPQGQA